MRLSCDIEFGRRWHQHKEADMDPLRVLCGGICWCRCDCGRYRGIGTAMADAADYSGEPIC